jgi:hypothetical protein
VILSHQNFNTLSERLASAEARAGEADVNKDYGEKLSMAGPGIRYKV